MIHAFPQVPELVHDLFARLVVLLLFRLELLLLRPLHLRMSLKNDQVPLFLLLLLVSAFSLPLLLILDLPLLLHPLVLPRLVLLVLQLLQVVNLAAPLPIRDEVPLLTHPAQLVLDLPEHLDAVGLVLVRHT